MQTNNTHWVCKDHSEERFNQWVFLIMDSPTNYINFPIVDNSNNNAHIQVGPSSDGGLSLSKESKSSISGEFNIIEEQKEFKSKLSLIREMIVRVNNNIGFDNGFTLSYLRKNPSFQQNIVLTEDKIDLIVESYKEWLKGRTYLTFKNKDNGSLNYMLASKRGNPIYEHVLKRKLNNDLDFMEDPIFKEVILRTEKGFRSKISNVGFLTLTVDPKKFHNNPLEAWMQIEKHYNIFLTRLRKMYGKVICLKSVEAQKNGFPHIHMLMITRKEFRVFKQGNILRSEDKKKIEKFWSIGFSDLRVPNPEGKKGSVATMIKEYVFKDMLKQFTYKAKRRDQEYLSLALGWFFGKKCYSISGLPQCDLIKDTSLTQTHKEMLEEELPPKKFEYLGISHFTDNIPDRPPPLKFKVTTDHPDYVKLLRNISTGRNKEEIEESNDLIKTRTPSYVKLYKPFIDRPEKKATYFKPHITWEFTKSISPYEN